MKDRVRIGYVGLGRRGTAVLEHNIAVMGDVEVAWLCDTYAPAMEAARDLLVSRGHPAPRLTADFHEILADKTVDAVFFMSGWDGRTEMLCASLMAGKYTATEVGCAFALEECDAIMAAHKASGAHLMMLENTCYARRELMLLRVVREGLLGELVHCDGGYHHDLRECDLFRGLDGERPHYRLHSYLDRNCDQYPTHELGPIMKLLSIGRGNRMLSLSSFASKSRGLCEGARKHFGEASPYATAAYRQGDIVTTVITCAGGETIHLCLDTTLPRPYYSRNLTVRGTRGMFTEERRILYFEEMGEGVGENEAEMLEKYDHPLFREYLAEGVKGGHEGADFLTCRAFIEAVKAGCEPPINTADTVTLMAIAPLSEESVARGGAPVAIPDYTDGAWQDPTPRALGKYSLDLVVSDPDTPICPPK